MARLTENAIKVLERRYLEKNKDGVVIETPEQMFMRVAETVAEAERKYMQQQPTPVGFDYDFAVTKVAEEFYDMMINLEFLPNSPTLMNAGRTLGQLSACFVLPVENTYEAILETIKNTALIHKSGGGTGFNFSHIDLPARFKNYRPTFIISSDHPDAEFIRGKVLKNVEVEVLDSGMTIKGKVHVIGDHMEDIFSLDALLSRPPYIDFNQLRKKGERVETTGGEASGPASFMDVWDEVVGMLNNHIDPINAIRAFNASTEAVKQGGTRRGANMGIVNIDHPQIIEFITCKSNNDVINNFNISVGITDEFMKKYLAEVDANESEGYATKLFNMIVDGAFKNGEPGIIFLDKVNAANPVVGLVIESTNPCGEQPLLPYEACNLGSINLAEMTKIKDGKVIVDEQKLTFTVAKAIRFLDDVIDVNKYPIQAIDDMSRKYRKIGLGIMGWADVLYKMEIPYNSNEAIDLVRKIGDVIATQAGATSIRLGHERGSFTGIEETIFKGTVRRNATTTTIAPTGTLSIIASVSSGIEPQFAISYIKNVMDNDELSYVNPIFKEAFLTVHECTEDTPLYIETMKEIAKNGTVANIKSVPDDLKRIFVTAHDITPNWHVKHQSAWQDYTENGVSKTVNLDHNATRADVKDVFIAAYKSSCKGVTVYVDGSRAEQVLNIGSVNRTPVAEPIHTGIEHVEGFPGLGIPIQGEQIHGLEPIIPVQYLQREPRPRPEVTIGFTQKVRIGCGNLYITVNYDKDGVCELFTSTGRAGGCPSQSEATSRLVSLALRSWVDVKAIMGQLKGIRCPSTTGKKLGVLSCPDALGRALEKAIKIDPAMLHTMIDLGVVTSEPVLAASAVGCTDDQCAACSLSSVCNNPESEKIISGTCPECGKPVEHEGGCVVCRQCGFSKCG